MPRRRSMQDRFRASATSIRRVTAEQIFPGKPGTLVCKPLKATLGRRKRGHAVLCPPVGGHLPKLRLIQTLVILFPPPNLFWNGFCIAPTVGTAKPRPQNGCPRKDELERKPKPTATSKHLLLEALWQRLSALIACPSILQRVAPRQRFGFPPPISPLPRSALRTKPQSPRASGLWFQEPA